MSESKKIITAVVVGILAVVLALGVWRLANQLLVVFAAILAAVALNTLIDTARKRWSLPRIAVLTVMLLGGSFLLLSFFGLLGARIYSQFDELGTRLPSALDALQTRLSDTEWLAPIGAELKELRSRGLDSSALNGETGSASGGMLRVFQTTFGTLSAGLIWLVLTIYLVLEPSVYRRGLLALIPRDHHGQANELLDSWRSALSWWVLGRLSSMAIVGLLTTVGLLLLGVPLPLALGALAGFLSFVPFLGPLVATIPATLIALLDSASTAVWVLGLFGLIQVLESYVITPKIERETVSVPPVLMITAQVLAGVLLGLGGVMFATPLLVTMVVFIQVIYINGLLGKNTEVWGSHHG